MIYCFPYYRSCDRELSELTGCGRLFAYPTAPSRSKCERIILDSGAFALSKRGGRMNENYMQGLSDHYRKYADERTICVAPDVVRDQVRTMKNYQEWLKSGKYPNISPVLQPSIKGVVNFSELTYQVDYYTGEFSAKTMLIAMNQRADIMLHSGIDKVINRARRRGVEWIHILGAGWDINDVLCWAQSGVADSIDSTSYYSSGCECRFGSRNPAENAIKIMEVIAECERTLKQY